MTADNGEEALEILNRGDTIDLLISDVVMPEMDGPTMVREARKTRPDLKSCSCRAMRRSSSENRSTSTM